MGKHTPVGEQRRLVDLWRASDVSMAAFAQAHGVRAGTFATWVDRHELRASAPAEPPTFLALSVARIEPAAAFSVRIREHELSFEAPPPAAWFAAVLRELAPC